MSLNTELRLYGGGKSADDDDASTFRDFYSADAARNKFCKDRQRRGKSIPQTALTKIDGGYRWHLK